MLTGGLFRIARHFFADRVRSFGALVASGCQAVADALDGKPPQDIEPPREWKPRLWERDHDARTEDEKRRP
jgi:hypothetical protein